MKRKFHFGMLSGVIAAGMMLMTGQFAAADEVVYQKVLKSVALVVAPQENGTVSIGTAVLVESDKGVLVTAAHVVGNAREVVLFVPDFDKAGRPIVDRLYYVQHLLDLGISAKVVSCDKTHDLAILMPQILPAKMKPIALARHQAVPGQAVFAIGNSGDDDDGLWRYRQGHVRIVTHKRMTTDGQVIDAEMIETDAPTNHGDSGGPVVNSDGQLLAITHAIDVVNRAVDYSIDVSEVSAALEKLASTDKPAKPTETSHSGWQSLVRPVVGSTDR